MKDTKQSSTPSPTSGATSTTEAELFRGLSKVRTFPVDPSEPGETPGQMLPPAAFIPKTPSVLQSPKLTEHQRMGTLTWKGWSASEDQIPQPESIVLGPNLKQSSPSVPEQVEPKKRGPRPKTP